MKVARVNSYRYPILTGTGGLGGVNQYNSTTGAVPWSYAQADGGLTGDGSTDDTAALQAWIDSITASGTQSGWFWFEPGTYIIAGALQDTGAFNAQVLLPDVVIDASHPEITLHFMGPTRPPFAVVPTQNVPDPAGYAILQSTLTGASGTAAVFSAGNAAYNNITVVVENLICVAPANPTTTFWNLANSQGATIQDVMIWTTDWLGGTFPTHSNSYGIKLPGDTQGNYTRVEGLSVRNFYTGILGGDLVVATGVQVSVCIVAWANSASAWPSLIIDIYLNGCLYGIQGVGGPSQLDVLRYSHEHYPADPTYATLYDLFDPSDYLTGAVRWWNVEWSVGPDHIFSRSGGATISDAEVGPLTTGGVPATTVTDETTYGITPAVGTDTEYARQDHTHGSPPTPSSGAAHYLVIASSHSTPLIFGDLVQTSAGDDLIYTS